MRKNCFLPIVIFFALGAGAVFDSSSKALSLLELFLNRNGEASHKMQGLKSFYPHHDHRSPQIDETLKRSGYRHAKEQHCSCKARYRPFELGRQYFPRYVSVAHCDTNACANRTLTCQQKIYTIKVLRNRDEKDPLDSFLPESLRADWLFEDVPVAVTCECVA